jgi:eukaryotic-like serine/threonine-protein kinase
VTNESPNPARWLEPGAFGQSLLLRKAFAQPAVPAGTRLGAYVVVEEIARGGMSVVYLAERADGQFAQRVAIKAVHGARSADVQALFLRERQLLADFKHAHVARLLDGGSSEDGLLWCAMELVEGITLDSYLKNAKPDLGKRLQLLLQLSDAVQAAHARLLVHRDIKPGNVMVDADGSAKLLDFGIATWAHAEDAARAYSPAWASPEQLSDGLIGPASDQYQLGRLLNLMLTDADQADHWVNGERALELKAIATRATQTAPDARYASVAEFSAELQRWIEQRPVQSYSQRWPYLLRSAIRRHPLQSAAFLTMSLLAIGLLSYSQWRLIQQRNIAEYQAETAKEINHFLQNDLLLLSDPNVSQDANLKVSALLERAASSIETRFASRPEVAAELHAMLGRGLRGLGALTPAQLQFERAQVLAKKSFSADDSRRLTIEFEHAELEMDQSKFQLAHQRLTALLPLAEKALGAESELVLSAQARQSTAAFRSGIATHASIERLAALQKTIDGVLGSESALAIRALNERAIMLSEIEQVEESAQIRLEHINRALARYGANYSTVWAGRVNYAVILRKLRRYPEALQQVEQAQQGLEKIFGVDSVSSLHAVNVRSRILLDMGKIDEAVVLQRHILKARIALLGREHEQVAVSFVNLGGMLAASARMQAASPATAKRDFSEAISAYREALAIRRKVFPPDHVDIVTNLQLLGDGLREQGDFIEADRYLNEALVRGERTLDESRPELANIRFRYAQLKAAQKLPEHARAPLLAALAHYQTRLGPKHQRTLEAEKMRAQFGW